MSYFGFKYLTLVPIQARLIDASLLSPVEVAWLDRYHKAVRARRRGGRAWRGVGKKGRARRKMERGKAMGVALAIAGAAA